MSQLSLFAEEARRPRENWFFAVCPDAPAQEAIATVTSEVLRGCAGAPIRPDLLHASLIALSRIGLKPRAKAMAMEIGARAAARTAPFTVMFDHVETFGGGKGNRPIVLRADDGTVGLTRLWEKLYAHVTGQQKPPEKPVFAPHVTIAYAKDTVMPQMIIPIGWAVRELLLIRSLVGKTEHHVQGRWPLTGPALPG